MELRAPSLGDLAVGDVTHEDVLERVLVFAGDAGRGAGRDEVARLERHELTTGDGGRLGPFDAEVCDGAGPEDCADDRRVVSDSLLRHAQTI